ncbi:MAG: type II secretion system F family protein [Methanobacteriota archaeon]|nr:MAG: type II secretion system F family protein [Euryarchaeota archaeon]
MSPETSTKPTTSGLSILERIGDRILKIFETTGESVSSVSPQIPKVKLGKIGKVGIATRLEELKRLQEVSRELRDMRERYREEEEKWGRIELETPFSVRMSETLYQPLQRPAQALARSFSDLDIDLYRANMVVDPAKFVALMLVVGIIAALAFSLLSLLFLPPFLAPVMGFLGFMVGLLGTRMIPRIKVASRVKEMDRQAPYVLRHMATQLKSGIGLPETMVSVASADYGAFSEEVYRTIRDVHSGMAMADALERLEDRAGSETVKRMTRQVLRTLRTGGDLADVLSELADEVSFDLRMKLRDYAQSLNAVGLMFMFADSVAPTVLLIMIMIQSVMAKKLYLGTEFITILYLVLIPIALFYFVMIIKRMEPTV